jgi:hypothetical protein
VADAGVKADAEADTGVRMRYSEWLKTPDPSATHHL